MHVALGHTDPNALVEVDDVVLERELCLASRGEHVQVGLRPLVVGAALGEVVRTEDDVLVGCDHRAAVRGAEDVV